MSGWSRLLKSIVTLLLVHKFGKETAKKIKALHYRPFVIEICRPLFPWQMLCTFHPFLFIIPSITSSHWTDHALWQYSRTPLKIHRLNHAHNHLVFCVVIVISSAVSDWRHLFLFRFTHHNKTRHNLLLCNRMCINIGIYCRHSFQPRASGSTLIAIYSSNVILCSVKASFIQR